MADDRVSGLDRREMAGDEPAVEPSVAGVPAPRPDVAGPSVPTAAVPSETVGTGSYVAVSCVAAMGFLLLVLIAGLLVSRWLG